MQYLPFPEDVWRVSVRTSDREIADLFRASGAYVFDNAEYDGIPSEGSMAQAIFDSLERPYIDKVLDMEKPPKPKPPTGEKRRNWRKMEVPTRDEVDEYAVAYCDRHDMDPREFDLDAFFSHYEGNGWMISTPKGPQPMKSWKHAVQGWIRGFGGGLANA